MKNTFIYTVIFTFITCFIFVLFLSFTNTFLQDKIKANARFAQDKAILLALGAQLEDVETIEKVDALRKTIRESTRNGNTYYEGSFETPARATFFASPGVWGTISGYIAFSQDGERLIGFQITDQNETPGLGARISEQWFKDQFKNEKITNNTIVVGPGGTGDINKDNGKIDGITGATRTSDSIQAILQSWITLYREDWR